MGNQLKRIFIIGVEGSGTTMMSRILESGGQTISMLGNHISAVSREDQFLKEKLQEFHEGTSKIWDSLGSQKDYEMGHSLISKAITSVEDYLSEKKMAQTIIFKRSSPFLHGNRYIPDLIDIQRIFRPDRILIMVRDPKQSSYSALRRGFMGDIKQCAVTCHINLALLSAEIDAIKNGYVVSYNDFCKRPIQLGAEIADFLDLELHDFTKRVKSEGLITENLDRYKSELKHSELEYLEDYFDEERINSYKIFRRTNG